MSKIRCSKCGFLLGELDNQAKGKAVIECPICKKVCTYSNPSKRKDTEIDISIKIKSTKSDEWLPF